MIKKEFETGAMCLNHQGLVASWWRSSADTNPKYSRHSQINIFKAAATDENVYIPAASLTINGKEALLALRAVIDEALRNEPSEEPKGEEKCSE